MSASLSLAIEVATSDKPNGRRKSIFESIDHLAGIASAKSEPSESPASTACCQTPLDLSISASPPLITKEDESEDNAVAVSNGALDLQRYPGSAFPHFAAGLKGQASAAQLSQWLYGTEAMLAAQQQQQQNFYNNIGAELFMQNLCAMQQFQAAEAAFARYVAAAANQSPDYRVDPAAASFPCPHPPPYFNPLAHCHPFPGQPQPYASYRSPVLSSPEAGQYASQQTSPVMPSLSANGGCYPSSIFFGSFVDPFGRDKHSEQTKSLLFRGSSAVHHSRGKAKCLADGVTTGTKLMPSIALLVKPHSASQLASAMASRQAPRFQCPDCSRSYSTFSGLSKHRQFHCSTQLKRQFCCKFCDKQYNSLGALKMHIRTHTLPCKCQLCGKAFSRPWLLQGHVRTHTGEKPFGCGHCGRSFADRSNLRAHLQTHSEVKKYRCKSCQKTFSRMSLLTKHESNGCNSNGLINIRV